MEEIKGIPETPERSPILDAVEKQEPQKTVLSIEIDSHGAFHCKFPPSLVTACHLLKILELNINGMVAQAIHPQEQVKKKSSIFSFIKGR